MLTSPLLADLIVNAVYGILMLLAVYGVAIWIAGAKLLRPTLCLIGIIGGLSVGAGIASMVDDSIIAMVWLTLGGITGGIIGLTIYRYLMSVSLAMVMGVMGLWFVLVLNVQPVHQVGGLMHQHVDQSMHYMAQRGEEGKRPSLAMVVKEARTQANAFALATWDWLRARPVKVQWIMLVAGLVLMIGGFWLGQAEPNLAAKISTAHIGVMLLGGVWCLVVYKYFPSWSDRLLPRDGKQALLIVSGVSIFGLVLQMALNMKPAKPIEKPAKQETDLEAA